MDHYLQHIGLKTHPYGKKLYVIPNPDGTPRWIWNADNPRPDFLRFYAVSGLRSRLFSGLVALLFHLKLQHLFFAKSSIRVQADPAHPLSAALNRHFALFTGTEGPNRKLVLYTGHQFVKIALSDGTRRLLENEEQMLPAATQGNYCETPRATHIAEGILALSNIGRGGVRSSVFTSLHAKALCELGAGKAARYAQFGHSTVFQKSLRKIQNLENASLSEMPRFLRENLVLLAQSLEKEPLAGAWAHGDFTPWNCFITADKVLVYDFELAQAQMPLGFDALHFTIQQGILADRLPWQAIKVKAQAAFELLCRESGIHQHTFELCLKAYLLVNTAFYLDLYAQQAKRHRQMAWLLNTWNEAVADVLRTKEAPRALLIGNVFDYLQQAPYAAVKWPEIHPKALSAHADIDLLMPRAVAEDLLHYLRNHTLVLRVRVQRQSNMLVLMVVLRDGSLLALDLIWQLRRKALQFMSVEQVLNNAVINRFGIKTMDLTSTQTYLKCFYGLNRAPIPAKYHGYFESDEACAIQTEALATQIAALPENKGFSSWVNRFKYGFDVWRRFFQQKGLIITFSGVDGAGKSTIIELAKAEIEKKLRKRVVVIRHRPSLLPILSVYTLGREKAAQKAASTLPRQGNNRSAVGSLLRFAYYYTDYFWGQFYVYVRYVLSGKVVLYDRYYFDFINDSVRSNIRLPQWLPRAGYRFLLQPHLNFFLYADPDTILSRKKELDAQAIAQLTRDYLALFNELGQKNAGRYHAVENLHAHETLQLIASLTQARLA